MVLTHQELQDIKKKTEAILKKQTEMIECLGWVGDLGTMVQQVRGQKLLDKVKSDLSRQLSAPLE